jgi:hypothetical protein
MPRDAVEDEKHRLPFSPLPQDTSVSNVVSPPYGVFSPDSGTTRHQSSTTPAALWSDERESGRPGAAADYAAKAAMLLSNRSSDSKERSVREWSPFLADGVAQDGQGVANTAQKREDKGQGAAGVQVSEEAKSQYPGENFRVLKGSALNDFRITLAFFHERNHFPHNRVGSESSSPKPQTGLFSSASPPLPPADPFSHSPTYENCSIPLRPTPSQILPHP